MHWKKNGPLVKSISTLLLTCHLGIIQKIIVKAKKSKERETNCFKNIFFHITCAVNFLMLLLCVTLSSILNHGVV